MPQTYLPMAATRTDACSNMQLELFFISRLCVQGHSTLGNLVHKCNRPIIHNPKHSKRFPSVRYGV
eukprot:5001896-Amphidinium_carterae.1